MGISGDGEEGMVVERDIIMVMGRREVVMGRRDVVMGRRDVVMERRDMVMEEDVVMGRGIGMRRDVVIGMRREDG